MKIGVLLTCHNRREKTLKCLEKVHKQNLPTNYSIDIYLTDDNSTDGTGKAVKEKYPSATVLTGDGSLFWAGGMRNSWKAALKSQIHYDYFLLLNDDTYLFENTIQDLIQSNLNQLQQTDFSNITIGTTVDEQTGGLTYGGFKLQSRKRLKHNLVVSTDKEEECDLGCANIMLVPKQIVDKIGILHENYTHGIADFDYTLRAKKSGFKVFVARGKLGFCAYDHGKSWKSSDTSLKDRIKYLYSPKGLQYKEFLFFMRDHFPGEVPSIFIKLWVKTLFPLIYDKFKKERTEIPIEKPVNSK
jgi:GT2 family glycosyltransferase